MSKANPAPVRAHERHMLGRYCPVLSTEDLRVGLGYRHFAMPPHTANSPSLSIRRASAQPRSTSRHNKTASVFHAAKDDAKGDGQ